MQKLRDPDRRSFLARVAGGAFLLGAGLILGAEGAAQTRSRRSTPSRRMLVDRDPSDPARLPANVHPRPQQPDPPAPPGPGGDPPPVTNPLRPLRVQSQSPSRQRFVICPGHRRCPRR